jgi:hypothetical protein
MENKNSINMRDIAKKFFSVDTTIEGPLTAKNEKQYMKASFEMFTADDDGFSGQSKAYGKCFFEDSHSLLYLKAQKALEDGTPLKIKAARIIIPTDKKFYILDSEGKRITKNDGGYRMGSSITLFLIEDENPITAFNQARAAITANKAWVEDEVAEEELEVEETKTSAPKGKK